MTKISGYRCDYCNEPIDLSKGNMITRHLFADDWVDPLFEQTELHFHTTHCHYQFHKLEERTKLVAREFLQEQLKNKVLNEASNYSK